MFPSTTRHLWWLHQSQDPPDQVSWTHSLGDTHRGRVRVCTFIWVSVCTYLCASTSVLWSIRVLILPISVATELWPRFSRLQFRPWTWGGMSVRVGGMDLFSGSVVWFLTLIYGYWGSPDPQKHMDDDASCSAHVNPSRSRALIFGDQLS
jgi:hypothetical protein